MLSTNYRILILVSASILGLAQQTYNRSNQTAPVYLRSTTGTDTYVATPTPPLTAYNRGACFDLDPDTANTGPATINITALGAKSILNRAGGALGDGDITANRITRICYGVSDFNIVGDGGAGSGSVTSVDATGGVQTASGSPITATGTVRSAYEANAQVGITYTVLTGDRGKTITFSNAAAIAVTLPVAGTGFENGWYVTAKNIGAGDVTITPTTSTISGAASIIISTGESALVRSDGTNYEAFSTRLLPGTSVNFTRSRTSTTINVTAPATASAAIDFTSVTAGVCSAATTFTLTGVAAGGEFVKGYPTAVEIGLIPVMWASATNTVSAKVCNFTGAAIDPAIGTYIATLGGGGGGGGAVSSVTGTSNEVTASPTTGAVVVGLPASVSLAGKALILPSSITLPATCSVGQIYMDTDATTGQRFYACESTNTWVKQGDGGGLTAGTGISIAGSVIGVDTASVPQFISATLSSYDIASHAVNTCEVTSNITLTGAATGDVVTIGWPAGIESGITGRAVVTAANIVVIQFCNVNTATVDPAIANFKVMIVKSF